MRTFDELKEQLGLKKFLDSSLGTLYFVPCAQGSPRIMARHFDGVLPASLIEAYVELVTAAQRWVKERPAINHIVKVEVPIEVGPDFVARAHHTYYNSTASYDGAEDSPEPPEELEQIRATFISATGRANSPKDRIVETVLRRSLLGSTGKTYLGGSATDNDKGQLIVVEPKITKEDLVAWKSTM
ncbi:MAG: hypothetical protein JWP89_5213 [Schlesneria sp.]|nr:hypothetical protein [Schlesneria sp.]